MERATPLPVGGGVGGAGVAGLMSDRWKPRRSADESWTPAIMTMTTTTTLLMQLMTTTTTTTLVLVLLLLQLPPLIPLRHALPFKDNGLLTSFLGVDNFL